MTTSSPSVPPSFDPALHLHSDILDLPSESFSDDLEALNIQRIEQTRDKVVIQHRAWNLSDVFRSDDDIRPGKLVVQIRLELVYTNWQTLQPKPNLNSFNTSYPLRLLVYYHYYLPLLPR
jgi:chromosome transmission fidelity protein 18